MKLDCSNTIRDVWKDYEENIKTYSWFWTGREEWHPNGYRL